MIQGVISGAAFAAAIWFLDLTLSAGAHPFWADKVIWIGAAIGLLAFLVSARLSPFVQTICGVVISGLAFVAATQGKTIFAASYAENTTAGQAWFFGWIITCAGLTLLIASIARVISTR